MPRRPLNTLLLIVLLLAGQWLVLDHAGEHLAESDADCTLCLHSERSGHAAVASSGIPEAESRRGEAPLSPVAAGTSTRAPLERVIRGPPKPGLSSKT